jgi:hypothetical protein
MSETTVPSPVPPWQRPVQSPNVQTLTGAGDIALVFDVTYLDKQLEAETEPYAVVLPDGNLKRQSKRIYIPKGNVGNSAEFSVSGTFVGFASLLFNNISTSAILEWDGAGWHLAGGNADPEG